MVIEYLRKGLEIGLDAAKIDKKKAKAIVDDMVHAGKLTAEEGRRFLEEVRKEGGKTEENVKKIVKEQMDKRLNDMGYSSKAETEELKRKIRELEKKVKKKKK